MVADHVCFALRTNRATEDKPEFQQEITEHLLDEVVIENGQTLRLRQSIQERHYGDATLEAIALSSQVGNPLAEDARNTLRDKIVPALKALPSRIREHEFRRLFDSLDIRGNLEWDLSHGHEMLTTLEEHLIQPLGDTLRGGEAWIEFRFRQLSFRMANHRGERVAATRHLVKATRLVPQVASRWEMLSLWVELQLDKAVFLTDACAYTHAIAILDRVHGTLKTLIELSAALKAPVVHSDLLGALYGTRLQAHVFAGRRNPAHYAQARLDSDDAMATFVGSQDLDRQYLYRCHLETDAGELMAALGWLARALHVYDPRQDPLDVAGRVRAIAHALGSESSTPFHLRHYCRLWAAAWEVPGQNALAMAMGESWSMFPKADPWPKPDEYVHAWEVIDWKAGVALLRNRDSAGRERLKRAIKFCLDDDPVRPLRPPIYAIGLACLADRAALEYGEQTFPERLQQLRSRTQALQTARFPKSMRTYFKSWVEVVNGDPSPDILRGLSRDVAY